MTYNGSQYEESIDIAALVASVLRKRWRLIIACAAGALLLGLYKGVLHPGNVDNEIQLSQLQETISKNNETIAKNESDITAHGIIIAAIQEKIAANDELIAVQQELRTAQQEKLEALQADRDRAQAVLDDSNATPEQTADANSRLLTLANDIVNVENQLNTIVTQITNARKDTANQQAEIDKLSAADSTLEEINARLREELGVQNTQLERRQEELRAQDAQEEELKGSGGMGQTVRYAVLGGILGIFFVCGIVFLQFLSSKKLRCSEELREKYDLPVLGEFRSAAAQKHGKFDRMLDRFSGDVQTLPDKNNVYDLIAAGIQAAGQSLPMRLAVTGTVDEKVLREVSGWLCKFLPEEYEVLMASNPVYNAGFLAEIRQYTVLLVEMKQVSDKREIDKLADVLYRNEVNVIGVVVL